MGYANGTTVTQPIYVGKVLSREGDQIIVSFMMRRTNDVFKWPAPPKKDIVETVTEDQIVVGPIQVAYDKAGVVIKGLDQVKRKWQEYIQAA